MKQDKIYFKYFFLILISFFCSKVSFCQKTYFGYADRSPSSNVNWAEIGKDITNALKEGTKEREEKLKQNGWSSELQYSNYKRSIRLQNKFTKEQIKLRKSYERGSKKVSFREDQNGKITWFKR